MLGCRLDLLSGDPAIESSYSKSGTLSEPLSPAWEGEGGLLAGEGMGRLEVIGVPL